MDTNKTLYTNASVIIGGAVCAVLMANSLFGRMSDWNEPSVFPGFRIMCGLCFPHTLFLGGDATAEKDTEAQVVVPGSSGWSSRILPLPLSALRGKLGLCRCPIYRDGFDWIHNSAEDSSLCSPKQGVDITDSYLSLRILLYSAHYS